jgi:hypothetical protein
MACFGPRPRAGHGGFLQSSLDIIVRLCLVKYEQGRDLILSPAISNRELGYPSRGRPGLLPALFRPDLNCDGALVIVNQELALFECHFNRFLFLRNVHFVFTS